MRTVEGWVESGGEGRESEEKQRRGEERKGKQRTYASKVLLNRRRNDDIRSTRRFTVLLPERKVGFMFVLASRPFLSSARNESERKGHTMQCEETRVCQLRTGGWETGGKERNDDDERRRNQERV